jgi:hypothetical protein
MIDRRAARTLYGMGLAALSAALVVSAVRAQATGFDARRAEVLRQARADQQAAGLAGDANRARLYGLHSTPELKLAKALVLAPGASGPLALSGRFEAKTTFLSGLEGVELASPVVAPNAFKATVTVAPGMPPGWATVYAFAPVSGAWSSVAAVLVGSPQAYKLSASNGWTIVLTPQARAFSVEDRGRATVAYKADYFKPGVAAAFESLTGSLSLQSFGTPGSYSFSMQPGMGSAQAEVMALSEQMMPLMQAGKYDSPEFLKLQAKLEDAQQRMTKEMEAQVKDPSAMIRKQEEFGCGSIDLSVRAGRVTGSVRCGSRVGTLRLTGQS